MTFDYSEKHKVAITMFDYVKLILSRIDPSDKDMNGTSVTPATANLFCDHDVDSELLNEEEADEFHAHVARLLFLCKRSRPDIQTPVAYLCTRVQSPNIHDKKKLGRVMRYLRGSIYLPLILGWDGTGNVYWHVDASFAVHKDMKSHTGGAASMGTGALATVCKKQTSNTTSSTTAEIHGVSDCLP